MSKRSIDVIKIFSISLIVAKLGTAYAVPLPDGTVLRIDSGTVDGTSTVCTAGSCAGIQVSPGFGILWATLGAGNDGGLVTGKSQLSGGQELAASATNTTPGDMTDAWFFFNNYGTFYADHALNSFSDTSNDGTTVLNDLYMAWNGDTVFLGGGTVHDYVINLDGAGGGNWSLFYTVIVPGGQFAGNEFGLTLRGSVELAPVQPINNAPIVQDIDFSAETGMDTSWTPDYSDDVGDTHTCEITAHPSNGIVSVAPDCSAGSYTSGAGYIGLDNFSYRVIDQGGLSATANALVSVREPYVDLCKEISYPLQRITTVGGAQNPSVNATLQVEFTGYIWTETGLTTGGMNTVKLCPDTTVDYKAISTTGTARCTINNSATASTGTLVIGDKLICTNKPEGSDIDRFTIKNGF